ncbi:MAG: winged helix-turn-helix domain-containing protein [Candidatus Hodarchaeales archaeon]|jgi:predicted transcriptional regulator
MSNNTNPKTGSPNSDEKIAKVKEITDPETVPILFHEKKEELLALLVQKEMNIIELKNETKINPGTIKRHLNDLIEKGLIRQSREEKNIYGVLMKFYRATAKQFIVSIKWPR